MPGAADPPGPHPALPLAFPLPQAPALPPGFTLALPLARLEPVAGTSLPDWCDPFLAPPGGGDFFASRLWYDTLLAHGCPVAAQPVLAVCGDAWLLPLLRERRRLTSLAGAYSLAWRPLPAPDAGPAVLRRAGAALGTLLRHRPPTRLDTLDDTAPGLTALLAGLAERGLRVSQFQHFGNWHEAVPPGAGWDAYLARRPPALRSTIQRKLARAARSARFELIDSPGPALAQGIVAYEAVRSRSWKPFEPFPHFDAALMQATAAAGLLRLGVLRDPQGEPMAAQYWIVSGSLATLVKLAHDEAARAASPGTALTALMIRHLIEADGVRSLDFGRGDDGYKQLWVAQRAQRIGLILTDPWHPAGLLELARQAASRGRAWWRGVSQGAVA